MTQRLRPWQYTLRSTPPDQRSRDIFSYPIFSYFAGGVRRHISGHTRSYLNELQILRWDYFFRPNMRLITAVDRERLSNLMEALSTFHRELDHLKPLPALREELRCIREELRSAKSRDDLLVKMAIGSGAATLLFLLCAVLLSWLFVLLAVVTLVATLAGLGLRRVDEIRDREAMAQHKSTSPGYSIDHIPDLDGRIRELEELAAAARTEVNAIERFRQDVAIQRPKTKYGPRDLDGFLRDALASLEAREKDRLNVYTGEEIKKFGPIVRWSFETDRKQTLSLLKPRINSIARRDNHYARYEIRFLFVHRGQLTIYDGFYDVVQGEMMGETRRHVVLGNIFSVQDDVSQDFDFKSGVQDAISFGQQLDKEMGSEEGEPASADVLRNPEEEEASRVSVTQTRIVRLIGNGPPIELKFVVVDERDTWIAQLRQDRKREEEEIANIEAAILQADSEEAEAESVRMLNEHEERLLRIQEYEERVQRSETVRDVERMVNQILEFARYAGGRQHM